MHDHPSQPNGLLHRARHDPSRLSAAIFERAEPALTILADTTFLDPAYAAQLGRILDDASEDDAASVRVSCRGS
ncbi:MAG: hypothetical protein CVU63_05370 [Deltaproteobacteria bacterium HGW-Deltaproteobacteria-20]|nr:MAG: hypothetical protein CVU63_05370 [Deltaproteobacteria bacterium HGW-Deltaproteobacteria-20]